MKPMKNCDSISTESYHHSEVYINNRSALVKQVASHTYTGNHLSYKALKRVVIPSY